MTLWILFFIQFILKLGNEQVIEFLIEHGADIHKVNNFNITAIYWAAANSTIFIYLISSLVLNYFSNK